VKRCRSCLTANENRFRNCQACGAKLPKPRKPKHLVALKQPYEFYVALNGADACGIATCGRGPSTKRRLDRDHDHRDGTPRGLLCSRHNRMLDNRVTAPELRALADYLDRHAERQAA
jgi:hypothetical protein